MTVFFLTLVILLIIITAMSIGVLMGRKPIKGSCGGMASLGMDTACDICGGNPQKCEEEQQTSRFPAVAKTPANTKQKQLAYDANREQCRSRQN